MVKIKTFLRSSKDIFTRRQSSILSAAVVIAVTYGLSMVLGILRERLIVARFYACCRQQLDVYYAAFRLPDMVFQLIVLGALSAAFIPVFSEKLAQDEKSAYRLASSLINLLLVFFLFVALIIFWAARPFSALITGNFTAWQIDLMAQMTRVMLVAQVFFLISNFFSAIVQSHQRFLLPALSPVVYNLGIIACVAFWGSSWGVWAATIGVLVGALGHLLIQVTLVFRLGFRYSFSFDWQHSGVKRVLKLMFPRTLALAASQLEATVSLFLATSLSAGSLTLYYLAQRLVDLPVRLVGTSIGQAALPLLSQQLAQNKIAEFKKTLGQSLSQILFVALPTTTIFLVLRVQFVRFAYGAKSFPWVATIVTGRTLAAVAFSIFSQSAIQLLVRGFYAVHDTLIPFVIGLISVGINVGLSCLFIFGFRWEIFGLALAFSLANFFNFASLLLLFNLKREKFLDWSEIKNWAKMSLAAVIAAVFTWASMRIMDLFVFETSHALPLLILTLLAGGLGLGVYLFICWCFKLKELVVVANVIGKLNRWRSALFGVEEMIDTSLDKN